MAGSNRVHLLDVGTIEYGECVVAELGDIQILVDGGHVGDDDLIASQLADIFGQDAPYDFDLLVVSHCHSDHIGALPALVQSNTITARWALVSDPDFGWPSDGQDAIESDAARTVAAGLREEMPDLDRMSDDDVASFLADAVKLQDSYRTMLATLKDAGCKIVRFQRDHAAQGRLLKAFSKVGLELLGPSRKALDATAARLAGRQQDAAVMVQDRLQQDADLDVVSLFRSAASIDAADQRAGNLVNLQSTIATLAFGDYKVMLGGDYQFVRPQVKDDVVLAERDRLLSEIEQRAPFDLVKLSHHGSDNAVDESFLDMLGATPLVGMSSGRGSPKHPPPSTLQVLQQHKRDLDWVRTDRNGHVTVEFATSGPKVSLSSGALSDPKPNKAAPDLTTTPERSTAITPAEGERQITTTLPPGSRRVTITVDLDPAAVTEPVAEPPASAPEEAPSDSLPIGGGRALGRLLFVTSSDGLAHNIGVQEADFALHSIRASGYDVATVSGAGDAKTTRTEILKAIDKSGDVDGVVILGGYDIVPAHRVDTLPDDVGKAAKTLRAGDADQFFVWSDDPHVDVDDDGIPELPVSRIPDARSSDLVLAAALQAEPAANRADKRGGVRNVARPFAETMFKLVDGDEVLAISEPTVAANLPKLTLAGRVGYLMLHGDYGNATRFWGETEGGVAVETIRLDQIPDPSPDVVFAGCCWGALPVSTPAVRYRPGTPIAARGVEQSIALTCLARGAIGFVGCTGSHYSPTKKPYDSASGLMHRYFFEELAKDDVGPALALFRAKGRYGATLPSVNEAGELAIRSKTLTQFTCLGLGW